jgi:hypothetical protein
MMRRTVVHPKGQVTIPFEMRKRLEITLVNRREERGRLVMAPMKSGGIPHAQTRPAVPHLRNCFLKQSASDAGGSRRVQSPFAFLCPYRLPTQWQEVLRAFDRLGHLAQQFLQVFVAVDKIDV